MILAHLSLFFESWLHYWLMKQSARTGAVVKTCLVFFQCFLKVFLLHIDLEFVGFFFFNRPSRP